jgi:tetratricopeptide (TPR) repeat protein
METFDIALMDEENCKNKNEQDPKFDLGQIVQMMDEKTKEINKITKGESKFAQAYYTMLDAVGLSSPQKRLESKIRKISKVLKCEYELKKRVDANEELSNRLEAENRYAREKSYAAKMMMGAYQRCIDDCDRAITYLTDEQNKLETQTAEQKEGERNLESFCKSLKNIRDQKLGLYEKQIISEERYDRARKDMVKFQNTADIYEKALEKYRAARNALETGFAQVEVELTKNFLELRFGDLNCKPGLEGKVEKK